MEKENRMQVIKDFERLLRSTREFEQLVIRYGWIDENGFHESDHELNKKGDPREILSIRWEGQSPEYGYFQSIECDSGSGIIEDIWRCASHM